MTADQIPARSGLRRNDMQAQWIGESNPLDEVEPVSDCCGAELLGDSSDYICSECKEHCAVFEPDPSTEDRSHFRGHSEV